MTILGLNAYHGDSAACLVRDGKLIAAAEEERFNRIKHWAGLPVEAIKFCLREASVRMSEVDHVAVNRQPGVNNLRRLKFILTNWPNPALVIEKLKNRNKVASIEDELRASFPEDSFRGQVHQIEHHLAHLSSAFFVSDFDEAVCVSVDGFGDFASAAWGMGRGDKIEIDGRVFFPHSLGIFYSALTQFLGFPYYGDEYKAMGLAPYGEPLFLPQMREIVRVQPDGKYELNLKFFRHHNENVAYSWNNCAPEVGTLFTPELERFLGASRKKTDPLEQRHKDLARSIQAMYEEVFFTLLNSLHARYQCPNLGLSGGCAMNSVANGKIYLKTPFRKLYLPAAAGDAGGAIGAAYVVWNESAKTKIARQPLRHAYSGPEYEAATIQELLNQRRGEIDAAECRVSSHETLPSLCAAAAQAIADGKVVGWFQGRMEWGPRALGNRSILCDPRRADMKNILNLKIKRRESFRPFAPSILRERVAEWFEQDDDVPFMMQVFQFRAGKRALVPAVCHVDGSGRLQTVHRDTNPRYYTLIETFEKMTGVPMILNTSFNENEPVVCQPMEALDCFLRTKMDVLVLGDFLVERTPQEAGVGINIRR